MTRTQIIDEFCWIGDNETADIAVEDDNIFRLTEFANDDTHAIYKKNCPFQFYFVTICGRSLMGNTVCVLGLGKKGAPKKAEYHKVNSTFGLRSSGLAGRLS